MRTRQRWQDWLNLFLGLLLFFTPMFAVGHVMAAASWNGYLFGSIIAVLSGVALFQPEVWEEWVNLALGLWLFIAPFIFGYASGGMLMWVSVIAGILIAADALWAIIVQVAPMHRTHSHHAR